MNFKLEQFYIVRHCLLDQFLCVKVTTSFSRQKRNTKGVTNYCCLNLSLGTKFINSANILVNGPKTDKTVSRMLIEELSFPPFPYSFQVIGN